MRIVVVGGGMQGLVIAKNLKNREENPEVVVADVKQPAKLPDGVKFQQANVLDAKQAAELVKGADAVVLAVPSSIAHEALNNLIKTGVAVADVSFTPDPPLSLHDEAKKHGAICVVDIGVAPGLSHILVGSAFEQMGGLDSARILVGGIPMNPPEVFKHAVYFNPHDLFSEYVRPARARKHGADIAPSPMDVAIEKFHDNEVGQLEMFLSDGLRSLLNSYPDVADMAELTLRWPGHLEAMSNLHKMGLLHDEESCRAIASQMGVRYPASEYPDMLLLVVEAKKGAKSKRWRMLDRHTNAQSAMSRTTGYTTSAIAMLLARKQFNEPGVHAPEKLGHSPHLVQAILADLAERGVKVTEDAATPA